MFFPMVGYCPSEKGWSTEQRSGRNKMYMQIEPQTPDKGKIAVDSGVERTESETQNETVADIQEEK